MHASGTGVLRSCNMATDVCCIIFLVDFAFSYNGSWRNSTESMARTGDQSTCKNLDRSSPLLVMLSLNWGQLHLLLSPNALLRYYRNLNLGPWSHLSAKLRTGIPGETSSATFSSPGICFYWEGSVLVWISPTLTDTNGLNFLASLRIHARTISLSKNKMTFSN